jgi:hypothetical protein
MGAGLFCNGENECNVSGRDFVFPQTREARTQANRLDKFSTPGKLD